MFFSSDYELQLRQLLPATALPEGNETEEGKTAVDITATENTDGRTDEAVVKNKNDKLPGEWKKK